MLDRMFDTISASITTLGERPAAANARSSEVRVIFGCGGRIKGMAASSACDTASFSALELRLTR